MTDLIAAHGGALMNLQLFGGDRQQALEEARHLEKIVLNDWSISDLEMIGIGAFSPLKGFMPKADWDSVLTSMHLQDGTVWTIPVTLPVSEDTAKKLQIDQKVALVGQDGTIYGTILVDEVYQYNKLREAQSVYRTTDSDHPGVKSLLARDPYYVAGTIVLLNRKRASSFSELYLDPSETRQRFSELGWKTVVGFQTRNPVHRAHEYIQKCALETVDGLLLHPLVGATKSDDIPADIRVRSYQVLLENYYPKNRVLLSVYPAAMRYAGPREAVFHALVRKNFGCTHFIVGRDHAGVGSYYGPYDSQHIFSEFRPDELGIQPLFFENSFYCERCDGMASEKTCTHHPDHRLILSGTKVRAILRSGQKPSSKFTRPEVAEILIQGLAEVNVAK